MLLCFLVGVFLCCQEVLCQPPESEKESHS